jgi:hypothetical protein
MSKLQTEFGIERIFTNIRLTIATNVYAKIVLYQSYDTLSLNAEDQHVGAKCRLDPLSRNVTIGLPYMRCQEWIH